MRSSHAACVAIALLATASLSGCRLGSEQPASGAPKLAIDCDQLAKNAAKFSRYREENPRLVKVRDAKIVTDNRDTYTLPSGGAEALILECECEGVWSNGSRSTVALSLTIDSEGQPYVGYQPK